MLQWVDQKEEQNQTVYWMTHPALLPCLNSSVWIYHYVFQAWHVRILRYYETFLKGVKSFKVAEQLNVTGRRSCRRLDGSPATGREVVFYLISVKLALYYLLS